VVAANVLLHLGLPEARRSSYFHWLREAGQDFDVSVDRCAAKPAKGVSKLVYGEKFIGHVAISYLRLFGTQGFQMGSA
jgi:hypothetical protein